METTELTIRLANAADVPALVELRIANAEAHVALDPDTYRVPARDVVARHFAAALAEKASQDAVFVAETPEGRVVGLVEVLRHPGPPEHQILRPEPSAEVHTVVLGDVRGGGTGAALLAAAQRWATGQGIRYLAAGIHHRNAGAVRFYARAGFGDAGLRLVKRLGNAS
ncbi:GNAT family N-acetyltransferase [Amycolatopsis saalfeldensis]|uniref:L-amino acid N-acyltransferase YncA n=1 Tax=Amycolatopsis saalfeldensis TaxID=394193 RepID=A0A1H8YAK1_9PSEU|nr:GNAT family N-acetyltransferase [Amycolatopsis saalfeldensis]SEP49023.1 L-amino acid N-acyltransferase YncA [Amycolatopsis saalfeldensis]